MGTRGLFRLILALCAFTVAGAAWAQGSGAPGASDRDGRRFADDRPADGGDIVPIDQLLRGGPGGRVAHPEIGPDPVAMEHGSEGTGGSPCHESGFDGFDFAEEFIACIEYVIGDVLDTVAALPSQFSQIIDFVEEIPGMVADLATVALDMGEALLDLDSLLAAVTDLPSFITNMGGFVGQLPALVPKIPDIVGQVQNMVDLLPVMVEALNCPLDHPSDPVEVINCAQAALLGPNSPILDMAVGAADQLFAVAEPALDYDWTAVPLPSQLQDVPCLLDPHFAPDPDGLGPLQGDDVILGVGAASINLGPRGSQAAADECERVLFLPQLVNDNLPDDFLSKPAKIALNVGGFGAMKRICECLSFEAPTPTDLAAWTHDPNGEQYFTDDAELAAHQAILSTQLSTHDADVQAAIAAGFSSGSDLLLQHDAHINADLEMHDTVVRAELQAHDDHINADLEAHDAHIDADLEAHDAHINADLEDHHAHINADLEDHDAHINADLEAHDAHLNADLEAHDELMTTEHEELFQRLSGSNRIAIESNLTQGHVLPSFVILGGPSRDPAGEADHACPGIAPVGLGGGQEGGTFELVRCVARAGIDQFELLGYDTRQAESHWQDAEDAWSSVPRDFRLAVEEYGRAIKSLGSGGPLR